MIALRPAWAHLFRIPPHAGDVADRRRARLVAMFALLNAALLAVATVIQVILAPRTMVWSLVPPIGIGSLLMFVAYLEARRGKAKRAAITVVATELLVSAVIGFALRDHATMPPLEVQVWLLLSIVVAAGLASPRGVTVTTAAAIAASAIQVVFGSERLGHWISGPVVLMLSAGGLALAFNVHHRRQEQDRLAELRARNEELEALRRTLEQRVEERTAELLTAEAELRQAQKLEAVGRLASGIAHELNTPIQYAADSCRFVRDGAGELVTLADRLRDTLRRLCDGALDAASARQELDRADDESDAAYLEAELPEAAARAIDGMDRIATIVRAMKEFSHPGANAKANADINRGILATLTIARNELKYVADVETDLGDLPPVPCHIGELNQVILNVVVNAAHAIEEVVAGSSHRGRIRIRTWRDADRVKIAIDDTGPGIPEPIRERIFEPFFTTKPVGKGTGQGLAIARSIIVDKHGGELRCDSVPGKGTTFTIGLPLAA